MNSELKAEKVPQVAAVSFLLLAKPAVCDWVRREVVVDVGDGGGGAGGNAVATWIIGLVEWR